MAMPSISITASYAELCRAVAAHIAALIRAKPDAVLGLATGSTPVGVYRELIRLHQNEGLDFSRVRSFNLDEYFSLAPDAPQSYRRFMAEQLFDYVNIEPRNWRVPDGNFRSVEQVEAHCAGYETAIRDAGGLDLQLLGIGRNGHIGFNEPGSALDSRTRLVVLDSTTRADAASDFFGLRNVPPRAITMGLATILEAREILLMASGARKASIIAEALEGKITSKVPASFLREHPNAAFWLDEGAASELASRQFEANEVLATPKTRLQWLVQSALKAEKTIEELTAADVNFPVADWDEFKTRTAAQLRERLDEAVHLPRDQTILCVSPHPDDDVICCGATLSKMATQNRVYVAYGVNGANAVRDKDVFTLLRARHPRLIAYLENHLAPGKTIEAAIDEVRFSIFERENGAPDAPLLRELKRLVREGEASDSCRKMGARPIFWNLPFYGDGARRLAVSPRDVDIVLATLREIKPDLVLLTGEHNDPHGTHELCAQAFQSATQLYEQAGNSPFKIWNYRGAWDEWPIWDGDYFCAFGKAEMEKKIGLILDHLSQLSPLFGGTDAREFWERARDRNRESARQLQKLGLLPPSRSFDPIYAEVFRFGE